MLKLIFVIILSFSVALADAESCVNVTYKNTPASHIEKKYCCSFLTQRDIVLEARSKSGWLRYAKRSGYTESEVIELSKCLKIYFDNQVSYRVGGAL